MPLRPKSPPPFVFLVQPYTVCNGLLSPWYSFEKVPAIGSMAPQAHAAGNTQAALCQTRPRHALRSRAWCRPACPRCALLWDQLPGFAQFGTRVTPLKAVPGVGRPPSPPLPSLPEDGCLEACERTVAVACDGCSWTATHTAAARKASCSAIPVLYAPARALCGSAQVSGLWCQLPELGRARTVSDSHTLEWRARSPAGAAEYPQESRLCSCCPGPSPSACQLACELRMRLSPPPPLELAIIQGRQSGQCTMVPLLVRGGERPQPGVFFALRNAQMRARPLAKMRARHPAAASGRPGFQIGKCASGSGRRRGRRTLAT